MSCVSHTHKGWAAARGSGTGALRSFEKLSVEVPVTPGLPALFASHGAMNTRNPDAAGRSPSRQSAAASVVAEVEEEVMVDDPAGWDSGSSGSVYQPSPRSPKDADSPSGSPAQYMSNKYEDHDDHDIGPVKVYTHTTAPRAIFPPRMIPSRELHSPGEEDEADAAAGRAGAGGGYKPISFSKFSGRDSFKAPSDYDPLSVCNSPLRFDGGAPGHGDRDMNDDLESPPRSPPMVRFAEQADRDGDRERERERARQMLEDMGPSDDESGEARRGGGGGVTFLPPVVTEEGSHGGDSFNFPAHEAKQSTAFDRSPLFLNPQPETRNPKP